LELGDLLVDASLCNEALDAPGDALGDQFAVFVQLDGQKLTHLLCADIVVGCTQEAVEDFFRNDLAQDLTRCSILDNELQLGILSDLMHRSDVQGDLVCKNDVCIQHDALTGCVAAVDGFGEGLSAESGLLCGQILIDKCVGVVLEVQLCGSAVVEHIDSHGFLLSGGLVAQDTLHQAILD